MKKLVLHSTLVLWVCILALAGCSTAESTREATASDQAEARIIKHEFGESTIQGIPKRIVALEYSFVDSLATLGVTPVGIADDNKPDSIIAPIKEKLGEYTSVGSRYEVNFELISSLQPDLIIGDVSRHKEVYAQLNGIAPTLLLKSHGATYQENLSSFPVIAEAVGKKDEAEPLLQAHQANLDKLKASIPQDEQRTVLPAVVNAKGFFAHTSKSYAGSLLESLGLKDAIHSDEAYPQLTLEQLVEYNPDVLFLMKTPGEQTIIDEWSKNPLWGTISAVKNNNVYEVDRGVWSLSRGIISAETIVKEAIGQLYP
ncbi:iron complex transport system substrate-binding protein [Paenibacillus forsythiae]|uniref:Iron complex transport system substrate-binding protein n=1 Tax=Paenibacillus forsythiae TaxID=365616 RepID=A0ABU3HAT3_9BACL|nr:Fe(3+) dicitrate ABC transporter substrate-binding protein [Paenibacillus forsythiae]MDT3427923.1 iron complex transport system substrate-binding protein [Paenibacillus forsythiae]